MLIRNPSIPNVDKQLVRVDEQIENLESKEILTDIEKEELKKLKVSHYRHTLVKVGELMEKEVTNPIHLVVTNPTHYAVALHFTNDNQTLCLAKGIDMSALMIMKLAIEKWVKVVEFKEVARDIYATSELYEPIINHMIHILGEPQKDMSLFDAIELAQKSEKLVNIEFVETELEKRNWEG